MLATIYTFSVGWNITWAHVLAPILTIAAIVLAVAVLYFILRQVIVRRIAKLAEQMRTQWDNNDNREI